jgi:hypothetical protein
MRGGNGFLGYQRESTKRTSKYHYGLLFKCGSEHPQLDDVERDKDVEDITLMIPI